MTRTVDLNTAIAILLIVNVIAFLLGVIVSVILTERAQARWARFQRTGNPAAQPGATVSSVPGGEFRGVSEEVQAQQRARAAVVERGADQFMEMHPEITRDEARSRARQALEELGAFRTDGV